MFEKEYDKLTPLFELFLNVTKYNVPYLTRLISSLTMLEYFSREYDNKKALEITKSKPKKKSKREADFVDRVFSLIDNINEIYNLSKNEIEIIAKNIKDVRTYYIHYVKNGKTLDSNTLYRYDYFIEDIVLINIYRILKIDFTIFNDISLKDFFYEIRDVLK